MRYKQPVERLRRTVPHTCMENSLRRPCWLSSNCSVRLRYMACGTTRRRHHPSMMTIAQESRHLSCSIMVVIISQVHFAKSAFSQQLLCDEHMIFRNLGLVKLALPPHATSLRHRLRSSLGNRTLSKQIFHTQFDSWPHKLEIVRGFRTLPNTPEIAKQNVLSC